MISNTNEINSIPTTFDKCTGCSACVSICPTHALKMAVDDEGFHTPNFDKSLCTNCKLCTKVCPINKCLFNPEPKETFAAMVADENERLQCSSGGVVSALSRFVIFHDGYVCGCITSNFKTYHEIISKDNIHLFDKLKGSKYVQSDIRDVFPRIKKLLREKHLVLFIGSGCQVAGLNNFLIKPYPNLITIDFICHGVPSPKVLEEYINNLKQKYPNATDYSTRDKIDGWQGRHAFNLYDKQGNIIFRENGKYNLFLRSFLSNCTLKQSCGNCIFAKTERVSDLTVADYWRIKNFNKKYDDKKGTSLVMCNTMKGKDLIDKTKTMYKLFETVPIEFAKSVQPNLSRPSTTNKCRKQVFDLLKNKGNYFSFLNKRIFPVGILNFHFNNSYGSVLSAYAIQSKVNGLGYNSEIINYHGKAIKKDDVFDSFREKFLNISTKVDREGLIQLQDKYKSIIVGSDQVWRYFDQSVYMLEFAKGSKNLISYAASFGKNRYSSMSDDNAKLLLKRFNAISVREPSGIDICEKQFSIKATRVLDPSFLLTTTDYQKIIDFYKSSNHKFSYIGYSFLNENSKSIDATKRSLNKLDNRTLLDISYNTNRQKCNIGEWLNNIKNAELIITNSYSVVVFAIIFKKNFICLLKSPTSNEANRIVPLCNLLKIPSNRIVYNLSELEISLLKESINYKDVFSILNNEITKSTDFLEKSLNLVPADLQKIHIDKRVNSNTQNINNLSNNNFVGILNFHFANNFGAVLVPFAMLQTIKKLGYKAEILNYIPKKTKPIKNYIEFRKIFLNQMSRPLYTRDQLKEEQIKYDKIIVGSDQVWRLFDTSIYMLDFVSGNKTLLSYAASFGRDVFKNLPNDVAIKLLNRFDAISVRESTGVNICNNQFGLPSMHVLDPTMLLNENDYEPIIKHFSPQSFNNGKYIAYSIINKNNSDNLDFSLNELSKSFNLAIKNILLKLDSKEVNSVGGWLNDIKNAEFVITDSFHATVFSILYRKNFICLVTKANGSARIPSLLKMFDIDVNERIVDSLFKIDPSIKHKHIDYNHVYQKIDEHRKRSILFLKNSLSKNLTFKESML